MSISTSFEYEATNHHHSSSSVLTNHHNHLDHHQQHVIDSTVVQFNNDDRDGGDEEMVKIGMMMMKNETTTKTVNKSIDAKSIGVVVSKLNDKNNNDNNNNNNDDDNENDTTATVAKKQIKYREREQWGNKLEFIFACMAFAIGLGNVWRFPYLCYKNGGGVFLIPYLIFLFLGAIPILFIEVGIGQYFRSGGITVWGKVCPLFSGVGYGTVAICSILNCYYIVILAWALLYFFYSFNYELPWSSCGNEWNTARCWSPTSNQSATSESVNSVIEFWENKILQISPGIDQPNGIQPQLAIALLVAWIICFFSIWKGVKSTGKVVYVTAIFPYAVITALFIRGVTLPGAIDGIKFYLVPNFYKLFNIQVWIDAGTQIFFSYGISLGCLTALGSYNTFNNDFYHQLLYLTIANSGTSLYAGFVIFSLLGYMAHEQGLPVEQVAVSGPGLAFIVYPRAVATMPWSSLWAVMFFTMILLLGFGSQMVCVESCITAMVDLFPGYLRYGKRREWFIAATCVISYLIGLTMVTRGGMYVFQLFDFYGASGMTLLWYCCFEAIVIGWIYKADRFYDNIEKMIGFRIIPVFKWCWKYITPLITAFTMIFYVINNGSSIKYNGVYEYPTWALMFGWCLALISILVLPISLAYTWFTTTGTMAEKYKYLTTPVEITDEINVTKTNKTTTTM